MAPKTHEMLRAANEKAYASFVEASNGEIVGKILTTLFHTQEDATYTRPYQSQAVANLPNNTLPSATSSPARNLPKPSPIYST